MKRQTREPVNSQTTANLKGVTVESASVSAAYVPEILTSHKPILTPRDRIYSAIERVAVAHNTTLHQVLGRTRSAAICVARAEAMAMLARDFPRLSHENIARIFGCSYINVREILDRRSARGATS
jgi:chromosomal replication initiation ATPase DnaA